MKVKTDEEKRLHEALDLINSDKSEVFVSELQQSVVSALARAKGEKEAFVESAILLTDQEKQRIEHILIRIFHKQMQTKYNIHTNLLGGLRVSVGDWKLDATLMHQLDIMKNIISQGE